MYKPTIGLEIHAELKTKTKLFCNSKNDPDEGRPNVNVCPVCMGYPGTLPMINREAIAHVVRIGVAVGGEVADTTYFDRKNYFYPDIPKGFQISQYRHPIVSGGSLAGVSITRVHLEEDTARSQHTADASLIDFNRAGLPLMELVTEPTITSTGQAGHFARELQLLLRYLGAGDANMEKGEMRVEANVSVSGNAEKGTKVEVKNLNSFRAVERAVAYEIERQTKLLERGEQVVQETRGWDEGKQQTFPQRQKEEAHDYRYFPEPDLTTFCLSELFDVREVKKYLPELPWEKRERYQRDFGIKDEDVEIYVNNPELAGFFEKVVKKLTNDKTKSKLASNYIISDLVGRLGKNGTFDIYQDNFFPKFFAEVIEMANDGLLSSTSVKGTLELYLHKNSYKNKNISPREVAEKEGLLQKSDIKELKKVVVRVIQENERVAHDYRAGKDAALQFLVGQGMKLSKGAANPEVLRELLVKELG